MRRRQLYRFRVRFEQRFRNKGRGRYVFGKRRISESIVWQVRDQRNSPRQVGAVANQANVRCCKSGPLMLRRPGS